MQNDENHPLRLGVVYLARFVVTDVRSVVAFTAVASAPTIQDGTGLWDGVDRLNPSKALVALAHMGATKNQPTEEIQSEHNANADPVAECRSIEQRYSQPVPQKHENPALKTEHSKHNAQNEDNAEDDAEGSQQATVVIVEVINRVFHSF